MSTPPTPTDQTAALLALVRDFLDPDECVFDHHGYCQAHTAGFGGEPMSCPHRRARELLAEIDVPPVHYRRDDGVDCCVHAIPVGPDSCPACRELADDEPAAGGRPTHTDTTTKDTG